MKRFALVLFLGALALLGSCDRGAEDGPPTVRLGYDVCAQCNMIISDERWATATIIDGARGPEPILFDDFNCQVNHEIEHSGQDILDRWSHDHATSGWIRTADAHFLITPGMWTPMASSVAAFTLESDARAAREMHGGDLVSFDIAWKRLGFAGACCDLDEDRETRTNKENHDEP
jgi:nitrous oxide reductase accessory protein NosL